MFSFYKAFNVLLKELMNQLEKVKIPLPSFEGEFKNTVTYYSRLLRVVKQIIGRGCSAKHCEQIYKVNRSWDTVLNNSYRVYQTCSILSALQWFKTKGLSGACLMLSHWYFYETIWISHNTDYGRPERKKSLLHGQKFNPNPKFLGK